VTPDAFAHLPSLRGKVTPPENSTLRATLDVLAFWDERARKAGYPDNWRHSNQQLEDSRRAVLGKRDPAEDLWIYGYGSLMWDPGFHFTEVRLADLEGYRRRFTSKITMGRGSPGRPALLLSLQSGAGLCQGLAFRIAANLADEESAILWRREMIRGSYSPAMLPMSTPQGRIEALVLRANDSHPDHVGELPLDETAAVIASGTGVLGSNRDYLEQMAAQLAALQIEDAYVAQLLNKVRDVAGGGSP
jgi:cation transport protein ChaC